MEFLDSILNLLRRIMRILLGMIYSGYASHLLIGMLIGAVVSIAFLRHDHRRWRSVAAGIILALVIGLFKELIDPYVGRNRDMADLWYTVAGGIFGTLVVFSPRLMGKFGV